jgi:acid-sensing ion channel, other
MDMSTAVAQICDSDIFNDIDPENRTDCENCATTLKFFMGDANQCFSNCRHVKLTDKCKDILKEVVTEGGVCFVYNSHEVFRKTDATNGDANDEWTLEGGYKNYTGHVDVHPRAGSQISLAITMNVGPEVTDSLCKGGIQAFKVYLHLPIEAAQISKHFYLLSFYHYTQIMIRPKVTTIAPELRDLSIAKRQCYFSDERYLRFYQHYTQNNCEIECMVNLTLSRCGCLMFHMPSKSVTEC